MICCDVQLLGFKLEVVGKLGNDWLAASFAVCFVFVL